MSTGICENAFKTISCFRRNGRIVDRAHSLNFILAVHSISISRSVSQLCHATIEQNGSYQLAIKRKSPLVIHVTFYKFIVCVIFWNI